MVTVDILILFRRISVRIRQGGNEYGKKDEPKGVFEGIGDDRGNAIHSAKYHFSRGTENDPATDTSTWRWQSSNAVIVEKKVFERIQSENFARRGSIKSPMGGLRDQSA